MKKTTIQNTYDELQKRRKKIKRNAILFAMLLFAVNSYAWFVFVANAKLDISASVVSWEIKFFDEALQEMDTSIDVGNLLPGMNIYTKKIVILNSTEMNSKFTYEIPSMTIFGKEYTFSLKDLDQQEVEKSLKDDFPFSIEFIKTKDTLIGKDDKIEFVIQITWPFESVTPYHKVTSEFIYHDKTNYYKLVNGSYENANDITPDNFLVSIAEGIYVESDDADSFWGEQANLYKKNNPTLPSMSFHLDLKVTQQENP